MIFSLLVSFFIAHFVFYFSVPTSKHVDASTSRTTSSRRAGADDDDSSLSVSSYTRRSYNFGGDDTSGGDELTSRSSRLRLSSRYSTDSDLDDSTSASTSRYTSKYKSLLSSGGDDDYSYSSTRNYSRFGSRDESDTLGAVTSSRVSRYSIDNDDDYGLSSTTRRSTRLSYLDEDGGSGSSDRRESAYSAYSSRRYTSDYKDALDDYKVTTPTDDDNRSFSAYSVTEVGGDDAFGGSSSRRSRFTSSSRQSTLTRLDSKDAVSKCLSSFISFCLMLTTTH